MFDRWYSTALGERLVKPYVHVVFGARQTGKSTLIRALIPDDALHFDFTVASERSRFLLDPDELIRVCRAAPKRTEPTYVFVDEAQAVPAIFDSVQHLYDSDKKRWRFVLCGSSARKLRKHGTNLLPGRSLLHTLQPLVIAERSHSATDRASTISSLDLPWPKAHAHKHPFPDAGLMERLAFGDLPGVVTAPEEDRGELLRAYSVVYLEEEIRREALVKDWTAFLRFLRLAATESGQVVNYAAISREAGISQPTVKSYYELLEDMFVGVRLPQWSKSRRKNLLSAPKFMLFDLGVRNAAAGLAPTIDTVASNPGPLLEQWVGLELHRRLRYLGRGELSYLRTRDGAEVDYIVELDGVVTPIEVKWTERPHLSDARHVESVLDEHPKKAKRGYIVCRCPRSQELSERITAIPWDHL